MAMVETQPADETPPTEAIELTAVLHALCDPVRLAIVRRLAEGACLGCRESAGPDVPKATLSRHFRTLRQAGLVRTATNEDGAIRNALRREDIDARFPGLLESVLNAP